MGLSRKAGKALRAWLPRPPRRKQRVTSIVLSDLPEASDLNEDGSTEAAAAKVDLSDDPGSRRSTGSVWSFADEEAAQPTQDEESAQSDERVALLSAMRAQRAFRAHRIRKSTRHNAHSQPHDRPALLPPSDEEVSRPDNHPPSATETRTDDCVRACSRRQASKAGWSSEAPASLSRGSRGTSYSSRSGASSAITPSASAVRRR